MQESRFSKLFSKRASQVGPVLIVVAAVLWAVDGLIRRSLFSLPPITIVFYEHLIGVLLLAPFAYKPLLAAREKIMTKKVLGLTTIIAVLSGLLGTLWFTTALVSVNFIPFSVVFLLQKLQPVFAIVAASILLKEKLNWKFGVLAAVAIVSAYFVTFPGGIVNLATGEGTVKAALFALGAAAAWGTATVFSKMLLHEVSNTVATSLRFGATTIFAFIGVIVLGAFSSLAAPEMSQWLRFLFIALSTGMVALWIYYTGLKHTRAQISTLLELVFPLLAVAIDAVVLKTVLAPTQYLAAVVLLGTMVMLGKLNAQESH